MSHETYIHDVEVQYRDLDTEGRPEHVPDQWRERLAPYGDDPGSGPSVL